MYIFIAESAGDNKRDHQPFFHCDAVLAIPNINMQPQLDEVQQAVNRAVQRVISVSKGVSQWSKELRRPGQHADRSGSSMEGHNERRHSLTSNAPSESSRSELATRSGRGRDHDDDKAVHFSIQTQPKNYFRNVNDNKEVAKLASLLSTSINSTKKVIDTESQMRIVINQQHTLSA